MLLRQLLTTQHRCQIASRLLTGPKVNDWVSIQGLLERGIVRVVDQRNRLNWPLTKNETKRIGARMNKNPRASVFYYIPDRHVNRLKARFL